jgi:CRP-like cAMP-binding protein
MQTTAKTLSDVPAINRFLSYCRVRTVPSKTVMIHAGDLPDVLYYIVDGLTLIRGNSSARWAFSMNNPLAAPGSVLAPNAKLPK